MLAKYYTFAGVLRMLAKYYTFTGDRFWAILRLLAKYYTFAGVLRMLAKYYTFAGVLRMLAILRMLALQGGGGGGGQCNMKWQFMMENYKIVEFIDIMQFWFQITIFFLKCLADDFSKQRKCRLHFLFLFN